MSTRCGTVSISDRSTLYRHAEGTKTREVGKEHKIAVPVIGMDKLRATLGSLLTQGDAAAIYNVAGSSPPRVYKILREENLDGDEIRISEILGGQRLGPSFYGAFSVQNGDKRLVVLEMDHVGKTLADRMGDLARQETNASSSRGETRTPMEIAVEKLYGSSEAFYSALFRKIVLLADHKVAHCDGNVGNIIPKLDGEKDVMLIDYGHAQLVEDPQSALCASINDNTYYGFFYTRFENLPNKSAEGKKLLALLKEKLNSPK